MEKKEQPQGSGSRPEWYLLDRKHVWHPYTQMATAPPPIPVERAEGAYLHTTDGRAILDGISSWWVILHGHANRRIQQAIARQAATLDQVIFAGFAHEPAARLAAELVKFAPPGLDHVFYSDDGSTSVEVALKMACQYWHHRGERERTLFVALEGAYHGDTFGAMAVGGVEVFHSVFSPLLFRSRRVHAPYCYHCPVGKERATCRIECSRNLNEVLSEHRGEVAAVIVEPMLQGAGGMIVWPREFLLQVREACDRHGVLLIADEVFTGFGRTGRMFACEHGPVAPDILCVSKALTGGVLPLAATLATTEIHDSFLSEDRRRTFFHGHSFTANPIACAAALESLAILEEEGLERIRAIEAIHRERLDRVRRKDVRPGIGDTRSIGVVGVIELAPARGGEGGYLDRIGPDLHARFLARDILLRPLGNVLYVLPPLAITDVELHRIYDAIEEVLGEIPG